MSGEPTDMQDAEDGTSFKLGAFPNPPIEECPVLPLGFHGRQVVFATPQGEIRDERMGDIGRLLEVDIFNSPAGVAFLGYWRDKEQKFHRTTAAQWFNRKCTDAGYWEASRPLRSLGVWPGNDGQVVLHCGDKLWIYPAEPGGEIAKISVASALRERWGPLYKLRAPAPEPADAPATGADGQWVRDQLDLWRFSPIGDDGLTGADVLFGWMGCALVGAVAPFRPHVLVYAIAGSGKTTLVRFVHSVLSAIAGDVIDSFTRAGLANDLSGMARPVLIDEAEASTAGEKGPVEQAIELIRRMATGGGAVKKMGAIGGGSVTQTAVGAVMLNAVYPVALAPADASRIAEIKLEPLTGKLATDARLREVNDRAKSLGTAFLACALPNAGRYLGDLRQIKAAFDRKGLSPRAADLVASLAAGRRRMRCDEPIASDEEADAEVTFWRGLVEAREAADTAGNPGQDALFHLFNWSSDLQIAERRAPLGTLIERVCARDKPDPDAGLYGSVLADHGIRLFHRPDAHGQLAWWLIVANKHPKLTTIFERTIWRDWRKMLAYLDALGPEHRTQPEKTQKFGLIAQRGLAIPLEPWLAAVTLVTPALAGRYHQAFDPNEEF